MIQFHDLDGILVGEETDEGKFISEVQDAVDLLGNLYYSKCSRIILKESNFHPDFFRLHTGLAGEILQKFSNYSIKLAIIGDFTKYQSKPLQDLIRECNKGKSVFFLENIDDALIKLKTN
jgi:hypothetical protein